MTTETRAPEQDLLAKIDALELSEQSKRLRQRYFDEPVRVAVEKPQIAMRAWQECEGQPIEQRCAHLFRRFLEEAPVAIHEDELTAGSDTKWFHGVYPDVENDPRSVLEFISKKAVTLVSTDHLAGITESDWQALEEAAKYFSGKTSQDLLRELRRQALGTWWEDFIEARGSQLFDHGGIQPGIPLFDKILASGLKGIIQEAEARIAKFSVQVEDDPEKLIFWRAAVTTCQATIAFAHRYAELAGRMASEAKDPARKRQLQRIAEACRWVPENPARSFFEAVQSVRLIHVACKLEGTHALSLGRIDQYLYPYFMADLEAGRLTVQEAADLFADLLSYLARQQHARPSFSVQIYQASSAVINYNVGGLTRDGKDASNELSWLVLHVAGLVRYAQPQPTFALSKMTGRRYLLKALQTNYKTGGGIPQFHNADHLTQYIAARGVAIEDARDWAVWGCSQPMPVNVQSGVLKDPAWLNVPLALDLTLHNGVAPMTGKRIGLETGDPRSFRSFEELYGAFKKQLEFLIRRCAWHCRFGIQTWSQRRRWPFISSLLPGCMEKGKDEMVGGQKSHPVWYFKDRGIVNAADSLTALKTLVFDEKKLTMDGLLKVLDTNFAGGRGEEVRRLCLATPKYGNELPEADGMVRDIGEFSAGIIFSEKNPFGQPYAINRSGVGWHYYGGKGVGALPDGRKAGEILADGSLSPMRGLDQSGPMAVLHSALAADFQEAAIGILNMRFPRTLVQSPDSMDKLAALTDTFVRNGGTHIQFNLLDHKVLLEAKKHPEKFKDLVVRIAGYSAYFIHLAPEVQDDIIRRTEHGL